MYKMEGKQAMMGAGITVVQIDSKIIISVAQSKSEKLTAVSKKCKRKR